MPKLTVSSFSCIESAEIELGDLTILVGPQASGKSVLSKLIYFANSALNKQYDYIEDESPLTEFTRSLEQEFLKLFPAMAWGSEKFEILYQAGPYEIRISGASRASASRPTRDRIKVAFSPYFSDRYEASLASWTGQKRKLVEKKKRTLPEFQNFWRFRAADQKALRAELKENIFGYQLFIPAGRSFFTSVGKAIAVFEHGGILDPITVQFGRIFASLRENRGNRYFREQESKTSQARRKGLMQRFFGGSIEFGREEEFVKTPDGRKIPFAVLSSGQQELLPLWMVIDDFSEYEGEASGLMFIEEPEAHLFPSAQADITNYLAALAANRKKNLKILITTHSPYVLANINNLLKAGELGARLPSAAKVYIDEVVQRISWLDKNRVRAYALRNGTTTSICRDGLIDAEYLDEVSGEIAAQFLALLEIENRKWPSPTVSAEQSNPA